MIPLSARACQSQQPADTWQTLLAQAFRCPKDLLAALGLTLAQLPDGLDLHTSFPLRVPRGYAARMRPGDPADPLLLQVLPRGIEALPQPGFLSDPVGDITASATPGLLHKYPGRVLLVTTSACPVHCRYCFRRHFPYAEHRPDNHAWHEAVDYIAADPGIHEVILSGGDPLSLGNDRLVTLTTALATIPHLRRLRIHTRMPVVLPERIEPGLLDWLANLPWPTVMVIHCNHANEIDADVRHALQTLRDTGITLLNQAVLLRNINNNADTLCELSETLFETGVLPYYLHLLDRVHGAAHFELDQTEACRLMTAVQQRLPGFLVPRLVREIAGHPYKVPVFSDQEDTSLSLPKK